MDNTTVDLKKLTDIGFKRVINKSNPLKNNYKRVFVKCKKCKARAYYDYLPFSLSNPLMYANCGHDFRQDYKPF